MQKKSREEKELQGTYEPSKEGLETVDFDEYERVPTPPSNWPPTAQKLFTDRCYDLKKAGYLKKAFIPLLKRYCFAVYMSDVAEKMIIEEGEHAFVSKGKWMEILADSNKTIIQLGTKLGFSPLDASKIPVVAKKEAKTMSLLK